MLKEFFNGGLLDSHTSTTQVIAQSSVAGLGFGAMFGVVQSSFYSNGQRTALQNITRTSLIGGIYDIHLY